VSFLRQFCAVTRHVKQWRCEQQLIASVIQSSDASNKAVFRSSSGVAGKKAATATATASDSNSNTSNQARLSSQLHLVCTDT